MKKFSSLFIFLGGFLALMPILALAQTDTQGVLGIILNIIIVVTRILIVVAVLFFVYTVVMYIIGKGDGNQITKGLVGLFIIVAFWGIIRIVQNTFLLDGPNQLNPGSIPCVQGISC